MLVTELSRDLKITPAGDVALPEAAMVKWRGRLASLPEVLRRARAVEVTALITKLLRESPARTPRAAEQLAELAAVLITGAARPTDALELRSEARSTPRAPHVNAPVPAGAVKAATLARPLPRPGVPLNPGRRAGVLGA